MFSRRRPRKKKGTNRYDYFYGQEDNTQTATKPPLDGEINGGYDISPSDKKRASGSTIESEAYPTDIEAMVPMPEPEVASSAALEPSYVNAVGESTGVNEYIVPDNPGEKTDDSSISRSSDIGERSSERFSNGQPERSVSQVDTDTNTDSMPLD